MSIFQISKIQVRRGKKGGATGIPQLSSGEIAWAVDSQEVFIGNGSLAEGAPEIGNTRILTEHDLLGGLEAPVTSVNGMTGDVVINVSTAINGFAGITDVIPDESGTADQITDRVTSSNGEILDSCTVWTTNVIVKFFATTGAASLIPNVEIKIDDLPWEAINPSTLAPSTDRSVWSGEYFLNLESTTVISISIRHVENPGAIGTCTITFQNTPSINTFMFTGSYPASQIQYHQGQEVGVEITSLTEFVAVEFNHVSTASQAPVGEVSVGGSPVTTYSTVILTANHGNTTQSFPAQARIRNASGVWSPWASTAWAGAVDHVNQINLNNASPSISYSSIVYPGAQQAIKTGDVGATISGISYSNVTDIEFTSLQVTISNPTTIEASKTITLPAAVYNITTPNVDIVLTNADNGRSINAAWLVKIANTAPTVSITKPAGRYRTGKGYTASTTLGFEYDAAPGYTITVTSDQKLLSAPELTPSAGAFQGSWATSDSGFTWTRVLKILDGATLGSSTLTDLTVVSQADETYITASPANNSYTVGGFAMRADKFAALTATANIGTNISGLNNAAKLIITVGEVGCTYVSNTTDAAYVPGTNHTVTITTGGVFDAAGDQLRINETTTVNANTTGQLGFTIEEQA